MRSYIKLDASFFRHPKAVAAGRDGRDLFIAGLCYSGDLLTDGFIPCGALPMLGAEAGVRSAKAAADALLDAGLWESTPGGYQAHDYDEYNSSSEHVRAKRDAARERMKRLRSEDVRANIQEHPEDVREQEKEKEKEKNVNPLPPNDDFDQFWRAYPIKKAKADAIRAWSKLKPGDGPKDRPPIEDLLATIARQKSSLGWLKDDGAFIPHASTWLNGRRWEDETATGCLNGKVDYSDPVQREAWRKAEEAKMLRAL